MKTKKLKEIRLQFFPPPPKKKITSIDIENKVDRTINISRLWEIPVKVTVDVELDSDDTPISLSRKE